MAEPSSRVKWVLWGSWMVVFPAGLLIAYRLDPFRDSLGWGAIGLLFLALTAASLPYKVNGANIFIIHWVSLVAYLSYGLFFEVLLMQFSVMILLIKTKITWKTHHRYPLNSMMFLVISLIAAGCFHAMTSVAFRSDSMWTIAHGSFVYLLANIVFNQLLLFLYARSQTKDVAFWTRDSVMDYYATLLSLPFGLAQYYLFTAIGPISFLYLGVPFVVVGAVLRLYNNAEKVNRDLEKASTIGHELAAQLDVDEVIEVFLSKLPMLMPLDYAYILDVDVKKDHLYLLRGHELGVRMTGPMKPIGRGEGISGKVWATGRSQLFSKRDEWLDSVAAHIPPDAESLFATNIMRDGRSVAVLVVASKRKRAYGAHLIPIVNILSSYFAIAIQNARHHRKRVVQSERCALTGLYNYRYFEEKLKSEFEALLDGRYRQLSLVLLDIDHFKRINDTYGHHSGNELLQEMASILRKCVDLKGTVARFGGEEFVILLPNFSKAEAVILAETIRMKVESTVFSLINDLSDQKDEITVAMTISVGVSTAPEDTDHYSTLLRNADRALYTGAKQKGRNRVAQYSG